MSRLLHVLWRNRVRTGLSVVLATAILGGVASGYFTGSVNSGGYATAPAATLPQANTPSVSVTGNSVQVSWSQSTVGGQNLGSYTGGGYTVQRYASSGGSAITPSGACGSTVSGSSATLSCTETGVAPGNWVYKITPVLNNWTGTQSAASAVATTGVAADTVSASANPGTVGTAVTYTATVTGGGATPTGSVTFKDGGTAISSCGTSGTVTLSGGVATCTVTYTTAGSHSITAPYSGDANYNAAAGNTVSQTVNLRSATDTLTTSKNPVMTGSQVTYTATVTGSGPTPTGSVTFSDGGTAISSCGTSGTVTLSGGVATCKVTYSAIGSHTITAAYSGDANYGSAAGNTVTENVQTTSTTALTANYNPVAIGGQVTYTATVSGTGATPTGSVTFEDGGTAISTCGTAGTVSLSSGVATCTVSYSAASSHTITAVYGGDSNFTGSTSSALTETVTTDSNTLTQSTPLTYDGYALLYGTTSDTDPVTVYYCLGAVSSCTSANAAGSSTVTPAKNGSSYAWDAVVDLSEGTQYTSQAYQTDPDGLVLSTAADQFTP